MANPEIWPDRIRPLRRVEYESLVERGLLEGSRIELLRGTLVDVTPQGPLHADVVRRLAEHLVRALAGDVHTRVRSPLALSDDSEPEPDIAVVPAGGLPRGPPAQCVSRDRGRGHLAGRS